MTAESKSMGRESLGTGLLGAVTWGKLSVVARRCCGGSSAPMHAASTRHPSLSFPPACATIPRHSVTRKPTRDGHVFSPHQAHLAR